MSASTLSPAERLRHEGESLGARLPPLLVEAERVAATIVAGTHGRRRAGIGETFWQFRRYRSEDPVTVVDWRQSARSQHLFVREREWEAAQSVWLWRDGSANMDYASLPGLATKRRRASLIAIALASLLTRAGEKIALMGEARTPTSGRAAFRRIAASLAEEAGAPPAADSQPIARHARAVMFSDFFAPPGETASLMARLSSAQVHGVLVQVIDPAEEDFPFEGRIRFEAVNTRDEILLGRAESSRDAYRQNFLAHRETLAAEARRLGWTLLRHRTDHRPEAALLSLYESVSAGLHRGDGARFAGLHVQPV